MNPKRHQTLDRILGWVGYGCAYSVDEEEAQAHRARQPDEEAATERRSVAVWAAADDTRGLSLEQLRTRLGGVLAKTHDRRSATRNVLGPAHGVDSTADGHGETQAAALLGPVVVPSDEQHETGSRLSNYVPDASTALRQAQDMAQDERGLYFRELRH